MYKMLIVDDEPEIASSIFELFQTEPCGYELELYKCTSGPEALKLLSRVRMDVVLTDINMPGFSGFHLVEEINRYYKFCQIIFITGFNSEKYMRSAIQYNNVQYVLKNEPDKVLLDAVARAIEIIRRKFDSDVMISNLKQIIHENMPILKRDFMVQLLKTETSLKDLQERAQQLDLELDWEKPAMLFLVMVQERDDGGPSAHTELYLKSLVAQQFPEFLHFSLELTERNTYAGVVQSEREEISYEIIRSLTGEIQSNLQTIFETPASVVLTKYPIQLEQLREVYWKMINFYLSSSERVEGELFCFDPYEIENDPAFKASVRPELETLKALLEKSDLEGINQLFETAKSLISVSNEYEAKQMMGSISLGYMQYISKYRFYEQEEAKQEIQPLYEDKFPTEYHKLEYLRNLTRRLSEMKKTMELSGNQHVYNQLVAYIDQHLQEDLTLTALSEKVHFNPSYISRRFKAFSGENLTDYITRKRMEKAKKLLLESDMRISDVAVKVGYDTATYFNRVFKKNVGITPREFKAFGGQIF